MSAHDSPAAVNDLSEWWSFFDEAADFMEGIERCCVTNYETRTLVHNTTLLSKPVSKQQQHPQAIITWLGLHS